MSPALTRREFLAATATAAGGLVIGRMVSGQTNGSASNGQVSRLTPYITIHRDGTIEVFAPKPDVGTGTLTSLPMVIAEVNERKWESLP